MIKARAHLDLETSLVEMVKLNRFLARSVRHLLSADKIEEIRQQTDFIVIDPDTYEEYKIDKLEKLESHY